MERNYLVLVNGLLWKTKRTKLGALKVVKELREKGLNAVIAYKIKELI